MVFTNFGPFNPVQTNLIIRFYEFRHQTCENGILESVESKMQQKPVGRNEFAGLFTGQPKSRLDVPKNPAIFSRKLCSITLDDIRIFILL